MAKKTVMNFNVVKQNDSVVVEIFTENIKPYKYLIMADGRHPNINAIYEHLRYGLQVAKDTGKKIDVSDYSERCYVFIVTPIKYHCDQYTAQKML